MSEPRCNGECCHAFPLSDPLSSLIAFPGKYRDGEQLVKILFHREGNMHGCRLWDHVTGLCTGYETRPSMCRDYPYERPCQHCQPDEWENYYSANADSALLSEEPALP